MSTPGVMFYSHDSYGLGHLRRTLALVRFLRSRRDFSQLIVTGSPLAHGFQLPGHTDYVKLPSVRKTGRGEYEPRELAMSFNAVSDLRRDLLLSVARNFRPRLLVVDHVPGGLKGELVPTLRYLKASSCRLVLGLRDVIDEPEVVRRDWARDGSYELLERLYDQILVYGDRDVYDPVAQYGFSPDMARKTRFVGYLGRERGTGRRDQVRSSLDVGGRRLALTMVGGGEDGLELLETTLNAIQLGHDGPALEWMLLGGPLLPAQHRRRLRERARECGVFYADFVDDVAAYLDAADVVVSMGGYNSVCELLSLGKHALIVPRVWPRQEQLIRAQALSERGLVRMLEPAELEPQRLLHELSALIDNPPQPERLPLNGLDVAADSVDELLAEPLAEAPLAGAGASRR